MSAAVRVLLVPHPGNGYWRPLRHLLRLRADVALVGAAPSAEEALAQLQALSAPPDLVLASPLAPSLQESSAAPPFLQTLAAACPPARIALFGHSYDAALDRLRWNLGVPSYLCWDELMEGDTLQEPRRLAAALAALLAGLPMQTDRARRAGRSQPAPLPDAAAVPLSTSERLVLTGLLRGWTHAAIARALWAQSGHGSRRQVERLLKELQERYGVPSVYALVLHAALAGLLSAADWREDVWCGAIPPAGACAPERGPTSPLILAQARQVLARNPLS